MFEQAHFWINSILKLQHLQHFIPWKLRWPGMFFNLWFIGKALCIPMYDLESSSFQNYLYLSQQTMVYSSILYTSIRITCLHTFLSNITHTHLVHLTSFNMSFSHPPFQGAKSGPWLCSRLGKAVWKKMRLIRCVVCHPSSSFRSLM